MPVETIEGFRLAPPQRRAWSLMAAGGSRPRASAAVLVAGPLDRERLRAALGRLTARHEILRTSFESVPGLALPVQVVGEGAAPELEEIALEPAAAGEEARAAEAALCTLDRRTAEDGALPRMVCGVASFSPHRHALFLSLPGLLGDAASLQNLLRELAREVDGRPPAPAQEMPPQYPDLAEWLNGLLEAEETASGRQHWAELEPAAPPSAPLPFEDLAPAGAFVEGMVSLTLEREAWPARAAPAGAPASAAALACWAHLLERLHGGGPGALGVAFDGRRHAMLAPAPGPLTTVLPVVCEPLGGLPLAAAAERAAAAVQAAGKWQEYFDPERLPAYGGERGCLPCCFESHALSQALSAGGAEWSFLRLLAAGDRFVVKLTCQELPARAVVSLSYDARRLSGEAARRLLERFRQLLSQAAERPARALGDCGVLLAEEQRRIAELQASAVAPVGDGPAQALFAAQAAARPDATALVSAGEWVSYGALAAQAERFARALVAAGVRPEDRVALCLERSPALVVAALGALEAGAAFVPIDPGYPRERQRFMLRDCGAAAVVVEPGQERAAEDLAAGVRVLTVGGADGAGPLPAVEGAQLAYLIYTSGSTGTPKGVMITHRALANHLRWVQAAYGLAPGDVGMLKTPASFDVAVRELLWPLSAGARLAVARPEGHRDPAYLLGLALAERVSVLNFVPSLLSAFVALPGAQGCAVRRILSGGEALPPALRDRCQEALGAALHNQYGPTEVTITASFWTCERGDRSPEVPIGKPVANARLLVVDRRLQPAPPGVPGELLIGGAGLARGYLRQPGRTAAAFVADGLSGEAGDRLYRSGDLVRRRPGGELVFLGRLDSQVKVRGFRIEIGEVEAAIAACPNVAEAAVEARGHGDSRRLVAYVVAESAPPPSAAELNRQVAARLPEFMLPSAWVVLPKMPLSPNGKLDRSALPEPAEAHAAGEPVAPRNQLEEVVAAVWTDLLRLPAVDVHTSFFAVGGHSLLATQVVSRLRETLKVELPLRALFEAPTVAELAVRLEATLAAGAPAPTAIARRPAGAEPVLSFAQQRLWFLEQLQPGGASYNIPQAVRLRGALAAAGLAAALNHVVARHEVLRTAIHTVAGEPRLAVAPALAVAMPVVDLAGLEEEDREIVIEELAPREARRPFSLAAPPLLRPILVRAAAEDHALLLTTHHIVSDAWSTGVLLREVGELYPRLAAGRAPELPALPIQYGDFAAWQREWLTGETLERQRDHWRRHLAGAPLLDALPTDRPRTESPAQRGATRAVEIERPLAEAVRGLARREGATVFMVLMAAFEVLLHQRSGARDFLVGTDIANRHQPELEPLIGFFVNQLVLRCDLGGEPSFREILARVREEALAAYAHQDLPFESVVELLRPERSLAHHPLFQVKLFFVNTPRSYRELPGLELEPLLVDPGVAKLDLVLAFTDAQDGLSGWVNYASELFDAATVEALVGDFRRVLAKAAAEPEVDLAELRAALDAAGRERAAAERRESVRASLEKYRRLAAGERGGGAPLLVASAPES